MMVRPAPPLLAIVSLLVLWTAGCGKTEGIERYAAPKAESLTQTAPALDRTDEPAGGPQMAWFFKMTGPAEAVAEQQDQFESVVASTTITGTEADWTLPDGWSQQPASSMRYATLTVDDNDPPLEVSVSKLELFAEREEFLLLNINRWRGQLGLEPMSGAEGMAKATAANEIKQSSGDGDVTLVDLLGSTTEFDEARMLAAIILPKTAEAMSKQPAASAPPVVSPPAASEPLTYQAPEEWQPGKTSMMRVAAFEATDGDKKVEITVIPAGGDLLSNVNRWRGQVGLEPWTEEQMQESAEDLSVNGAMASYVSLEGEEETILAAVLPQGDRSWFFKLMGPPDLARREADRFKAFVESVKLAEE